MPNPFTDPMAEFKLRANPKTRPYLDDPDFVAKFYQLKKNPQSMMSMMGDKRIMEAICAILEVDLTNMGGRKGKFCFLCYRGRGGGGGSMLVPFFIPSSFI